MDEEASENELSELELAELALEKKKRKRKNRDTSFRDRTSPKKKKRRRIVRVDSSSDDEAPSTSTSLKTQIQHSIISSKIPVNDSVFKSPFQPKSKVTKPVASPDTVPNNTFIASNARNNCAVGSR